MHINNMWDDVDAVSGLNRTNIFQGVYYARPVNSLSYKEFDQFLGTTQKAIDSLATIKYNPAYCQFLSKEIGYDFAKGFYNLEKTPLVLDIKHTFDQDITACSQSFGKFYGFSIETTKLFLNNVTNFNLSTIIGHELGHHLIFGSEYSQDLDKSLNEKPVNKSQNYKLNWQEEFDADKISIASNLNNDIGLATCIKSTKKSKLNNAYQNGLFPKPIANILADFCLVRNEIILHFTNNYGLYLTDKQKALIDKTLDLLNINLATTHPPDITRTVESEKFAAKCVNFLNNPKP